MPWCNSIIATLHQSRITLRHIKKGWGEPSASIELGTNAPYKITLAYDISEASQAALDQSSALPLEEHSESSVVSVMPMITAYRQDVRQRINDIWLQKKKL